MKTAIITTLVILALSVVYDADAGDRESATYVGGGRYMGEGNSVDSAALKQRNNTWTQREIDRYNYERDSYQENRYDRMNERDYDYDQYDYGRYDDY